MEQIALPTTRHEVDERIDRWVENGSNIKTKDGVMPAKSISWQWNAPRESDATQVLIQHNGVVIGYMYKNLGWWVAEVDFKVDGKPIYFELKDGHEDMRALGNQVWSHFRAHVVNAGKKLKY